MFTETELKYISDRDFLLTKMVVVDKVVHMFAELEGELKTAALSSSFNFPPGTFIKSGKISKGENFRGLPYVILDYPRLFSQEAIFAYRTMFWWGNFFSNTLHVSGSALQHAPSNNLIKTSLPLYVQTSGDPWDHSLSAAEETSSVQVASLFNGKNAFIKISQTTSLSNYDAVANNSIDFFKQLFC